MHYNIIYGDMAQGSQVVSIAMAKANSNIPETESDDLYALLLIAAVEDAENYIESTILKRSVTIQLSEWPKVFELPIYPVQSIEQVQYVDADGVLQTVADGDYLLYEVDRANKLKFGWQSVPGLQGDNDFPITITCTAGYDNDKMPPGIQSAVLLRFSHKERFREDGALPTSYKRSFQAALRPYKRWG